jgi:hypothetical protein
VTLRAAPPMSWVGVGSAPFVSPTANFDYYKKLHALGADEYDNLKEEKRMLGNIKDFHKRPRSGQ